MAVFGLAAPAFAAPAAPAKSQDNAVPLCADAKKGEMRCFALRRVDVNGGKGVKPNATVAGYGPSDLRDAYKLPADGGAGQTVAIVDAFDDPNAEADLAVYRTQFGLPACTTANGCFRKVDQRGGTQYPAPDANWAGEISLDVDMVSAVAPLAKILLVEADTPSDINLATAVDEAVALGAKYVSNSYGTPYSSTPGSGEDPSETTTMDPHYNHPGVAVVASSGDSNFGVSYPAASQFVTSVGGTSLARDTSARGFTESVWHNSFGGPGSGCSLYEAKPSFQTDTGCAKRTETDVSAVSDPETGVAVYDSFQNSGWGVFGGTSAAAPIITGTYAIAGTPAANTHPNSYPYAKRSALNDVTAGNNGTCTPTYLCTAGAGYDGPTGLGTPNGVTAFAAGPHGDIVGTITDSATNAPIPGAQVTAGSGTATTDANGKYDLTLAPGTYTVTASAFGYASASATGVVLADGATVTENLALAVVPRSTISGTVTDGSGHHWPLYAKITIDGVPGGPIFTDPFTGGYAVTLPRGATYTMHVTANYPGYAAVTATVALGTTDKVADIAVPVAADCTAAGYAAHFTGATQSFDGATTPTGWTVTNANANGGWVFNDPGARGNLTGGSGGFAIIDSDNIGQSLTENTTLTSPTFNMSTVTSPDIGFDTDYRAFSNSVADVDVSVDGGTTWTNVWEHTADNFRGPAHVNIPLPQAANKAAVKARFHYTGTWAWWWELDNVFVGARTCDPVTGGLVVGQVTDANTRAGINGATVASVDAPAETAVSAATPDDPNLGDGFYWLFSSKTDAHSFTASKPHYTTQAKTVTVAADAANRADFALPAGQITVTPTSIDKTLAWQGTATATLNVRNTGSAPATVNLSESSGDFTLLSVPGAQLHTVRGTYSSHALAVQGRAPSGMKVAPHDVTPAEAPWTAIADYPTPVQDNLAAADGGKVYSAFGFTGTADTSALYSYDPDTGSWTALASAADTREKPAGGFVGGKFYVSGGWGADGNPDAKTEIYDPGTNTWSTGTPNPKPYAGSGSVVLGSKVYAVGGCSAQACGTSDVMVLDTADGTWSQAASYPEATAWVSCGALGGKVYCAGGTTDSGSIQHSYVYDPGTDSWTQVADLPADLWGSSYAAEGGKLLVSGGVTANNTTLTNQGYAYDPAANAWSALPNANETLYRGGSACGFYAVGGSPGGALVPPVASSEVLPGAGDCNSTSDVPWLSESPTTMTIAPGAVTKVTVTLDASVPSITQPGVFTAKLNFSTDTPYAVTPVDVSMTVNPPKSWGKIAGTVTSASGTALPGVTVQINTWAATYTLKTDKNGHYALWLDVRNNPLSVIAAKDGYQPVVKTVRIVKGTTTAADFLLKPSS
jgi:N-acetylneuraminic acid mutarotase